MIAFGVFFFSDKKKWKDNAKIIGIVAVIGAIVTSGALAGTAAVTTEDIDTPVEWKATFAEADANMVQITPTHFKIQMTYNQTSAAFEHVSQWNNITGTVSRLDDNNEPAFGNAKIVSIGEYTSATATWQERPMVAKNTDGTWQATWVDSAAGTFNAEMGIPRLDTMRSDTFTLRLVLDGTMPDGMAQYDSVISTFEVCGVEFTVEAELTTIIT